MEKRFRSLPFGKGTVARPGWMVRPEIDLEARIRMVIAYFSQIVET